MSPIRTVCIKYTFNAQPIAVHRLHCCRFFYRSPKGEVSLFSTGKSTKIEKIALDSLFPSQKFITDQEGNMPGNTMSLSLTITGILGFKIEV